MKKTAFFALISASFGLLSANGAVDCVVLSRSIKASVASEQSKVLEIVSKEVAAAPSCACEIVKAAIEGANASVQTVAAIVEAAATAAPEQMQLVSQCAVAVAPDALASVQAVIAKLDPNGAAEENPLEFPGVGSGPTPGGPGGLWLISKLPPFIIAPPDVSNVDPDDQSGDDD